MTQSTDFGPQLPSSLLEALQCPFSHLDVQLRAGEPREKDGQWFCQAIPHVPRWIYEERLHEVVPGAWSSLSPSLVVADDHLTLAVQVKIGSIIHTSYGEMRIPRLAVPDMLGEIVISAPDAFSVAFIDACHRFGLGRYLLQLSRRWVPYDTEHQSIRLTREEQRLLVQKLYQEAGLPLDLPETQKKAVRHGKVAAALPGAENHNREQPVQPESLEEARARLRAHDLTWVQEQCAGKPLQNILTKYRLKCLADISDTDLAAVIRGIRKRQAS